MLSQKSVLARLLSNENITVQQGNFQTAFFDTKQRLLGLPLWKQMSNDVYDLLVGHEVGHALYTPEDFCDYEGYSDVPHSWTNIVEDIRIERLQLQKYPGLVGNFKRGYYYLFNEMDLFGVKGQDLSELSFMDRLNLYSKSRGLVDIHFDEDELPYVAKAMGVQTYENVISVCKEIAEWLGTEDEGEQEGEPQGQGQGDETEESQDGDQSSSEDEDGDEEEISTDGQVGQDGEGEDGDDEAKGSSSELEESDSDEGETEISTDPSSNLGEAFTDINFHQNQSELVDDSQVYVEGLTRAQMDASTVSYDMLAKSRQERALEFKKYGHYYPESQYNTWLLETKKVVNLMVKEFEMRKAAYRSARARTATRGSLDVNKLHQYRYDDHLFKQVTRLADAKNHGMVMLVDYSGSMYHMLPAVLKQTLALSMFCKRVGIPFEVYGFTSVQENTKELLGQAKKDATGTITRMDTSDFVLLDLLSSSMKKREYDEAVRMMFWQSANLNMRSRLETLGNTPLNAALMAMTYKIDDFRSKYAVDKMSLITLTDGDSNYLRVAKGEDYYAQDDGLHQRGRTKAQVKVGKRSVSDVKQWGDNRNTTAKFVELIRSMGVTCVNYFICSNSYELNGELRRASGWIDEDIKAARKAIRKDGAAIFDENNGYNRRFVIDGRNAALSGEIDELDVDSDMTATKIAKAFSKSNGSKKKSRLVTQKFAEMVAQGVDSLCESLQSNFVIAKMKGFYNDNNRF